MLINFTKMQGLGNDFMVIDAINQSISLSTMQIQKLADRHFGVGFDQLLLIEKTHSEGIDFKYRIFNADGGEIEQCGNGARCFARFVKEKDLTGRSEIFVETKNNPKMRIVIMEKDFTNIDFPVYVDMGIPIFNPNQIPFRQIESNKATYTVKGYELGVVSMGNPHAVLIVNDINQEIESIAKTIQGSDDFPQGVNVNFVEIIDKSNVKLRVYERGAGETLACGSGACATFSYLHKISKVEEMIMVKLKGGSLHVKLLDKKVTMIGDANFVFEGQIEI